MHAETVKEVMDGLPFQPFVVHTVSGARYLIDHPDFAMLSRGGRSLYISLPDGEGERVRIVDTALIERLEPVDTSHAG
jgi:hypothetical protein